jgi:hypothetical protein
MFLPRIASLYPLSGVFTTWKNALAARQFPADALHWTIGRCGASGPVRQALFELWIKNFHRW